MSKPKVLISTDLGSDDKDDAQSLIHALLYADELDYRGFVSTLSDHDHRPAAKPGVHFNAIFDAYAEDLSNLREHGEYPSASALRSRVEYGSTEPAWPGGLSDGARLIIEEAREASPQDPLWVQQWGPIHDIAAALRAAPDIVPNVRLYSVLAEGQDPDNTKAHDWLVNAVRTNPAYKDLWWIDSVEGIRGMYLPENGRNVTEWNLPWVKQNVDGHGALGDLFHDTYAYDIFSNDLGWGRAKRDGLKMGDTPALLYLVDNVDDDNPAANSWGGSFKKSGLGPNTWVDREDGSLEMGGYDGARTVYRHRDDVWGEFAELMDRTLAKGPGEGDGGDKSNGGGNGNERPDHDAGQESPRPEGPSGQGIAPGRVQAQTLELSGGYSIEDRSESSEGANIKVSGNGSAWGAFDGPDGVYTLTVGYYDESDGDSNWSLHVDGREVASWAGNGGDDSLETIAVEMALEQGDRIEIRGSQDRGSHARVDWLEVSGGSGEDGSGQDSPPSDGDTDPKPEGPDGPGLAPGRTQAQTLELSGGYKVEDRNASSDGANIKAYGNGTAWGAFDGPDGVYTLKVGYYDEFDGDSNWSLHVDGREVASWAGNGGDDSLEIMAVEMALEQGDRIEIQGSQDRGSHARVDWLEIAEFDLTNGIADEWSFA